MVGVRVLAPTRRLPLVVVHVRATLGSESSRRADRIVVGVVQFRSSAGIACNSGVDLSSKTVTSISLEQPLRESRTSRR